MSQLSPNGYLNPGDLRRSAQEAVDRRPGSPGRSPVPVAVPPVIAGVRA
ncbi:hypothetical protein [Actinoplanes siamensis]